MTAAIEFRGVSRVFGDVRAVDDVSFAIEPGEFFAMLGPSGSGKTSCLRLVAGFDSPDGGQVLLDGAGRFRRPALRPQRQHRVPGLRVVPAHDGAGERRLWPARARRRRKPIAQQRAREMLDLVQLGTQGERRPAQLSGGQRQRVALARALINQPKVLLLDEPLGALDLKLREEMQIELKSLQRRLGITFVYVTHDQGEALVDGRSRRRVQQGQDRAARGAARAVHAARHVVRRAVRRRRECGECANWRQTLAGRQAQPFAIRAENIAVLAETAAASATGNSAAGAVVAVQYHGAASRWQVKLDAGEVWSALVTEEDSRALNGLARRRSASNFPGRARRQ